MLHEAKVESIEARGRPNFTTKLVGHNVCNNCYADAIGYSQRQFKYLKRSILMHERSSGQHGNSDRSRELLHAATCRAMMEAILRNVDVHNPTDTLNDLAARNRKK